MIAEESLSSTFDDYHIEVPVAFVDIATGACKWTGERAGCAMNWYLHFRTILNDSASCYDIKGWVQVRCSLEDGSLDVFTGPGTNGVHWVYNGMVLNLSACGTVIDEKDMNATRDNITIKDIKRHVSKNDSISALAAAQKYKTGSKDIIELEMELMPTKPSGPYSGQPVWKMTWRYDAITHSESETVVLSAVDLKLLDHD